MEVLLDNILQNESIGSRNVNSPVSVCTMARDRRVQLFLDPDPVNYTFSDPDPDPVD
jgi:hypothetical protein